MVHLAIGMSENVKEDDGGVKINATLHFPFFWIYFYQANMLKVNKSMHPDIIITIPLFQNFSYYLQFDFVYLFMEDAYQKEFNYYALIV